MVAKCNQMVAHLVRIKTKINGKGTYWFEGLTRIGRKKENQSSFLISWYFKILSRRTTCLVVFNNEDEFNDVELV